MDEHLCEADEFMKQMTRAWEMAEEDCPQEFVGKLSVFQNAYQVALNYGGTKTGKVIIDDNQPWELVIFSDYSSCWIMQAGHGTAPFSSFTVPA